MSAMPEREAKNKRCPRPAPFVLDNGGWCIGSNCMAWRWCETMVNGPDSYISEPGPKGYCGLAGLPLELQ